MAVARTLAAVAVLVRGGKAQHTFFNYLLMTRAGVYGKGLRFPSRG